MSEPIFLIRQTSEQEGYSGYYDDEVIDIDYGYFTTREEAEEAIVRIITPVETQRAKALEKYQIEVAEWKAKDEELRKLGGKNAAWFPSAHSVPDMLRLDVVEVKHG